MLFRSLAATTGEDGWTAGKTCALLLATACGRASDAAAVPGDAGSDRAATDTDGIARVVGVAKSIQSQKGTERCMTKPDGKAVVSSCGTRVGADGTLCRTKENIGRWNTSCDPDHRQANPCSDIMPAVGN